MIDMIVYRAMHMWFWINNGYSDGRILYDVYQIMEPHSVSIDSQCTVIAIVWRDVWLLRALDCDGHAYLFHSEYVFVEVGMYVCDRFVRVRDLSCLYHMSHFIVVDDV